jgi:ATP-dependent DNA helicase
MQDRMKLQDMKSQQQDEAEKKREEEQKAQTEQVAASSQRKATRAFASGISDEVGGKIASAKSKQIPTRGKPKKNALITQYLKKEDLQAKTGGLTTAEALAEAAKEHDVKPSGLGAQDLRPADQPRAVSGGVMRGYQLEGLYWLRSLYENGLNGILADEMGLGKTIQTISFLAFLREKGTNGPFLIVAPLSTLGNWIDEFAKWTPSIPTVLYHGNPADRAEIRRTRLDRQGSETFPVVCTSYEICMNDRKFLSQYGWKYIIIVSRLINDVGHC